MPPQPQGPQDPAQNKKEGIDPKDILLPKKEVHSPASAQRINAGVLLEQETSATLIEEKPTAPTVPQAKKEEQPFVRPLQTYRGDIEGLVQEKNVSVVHIAAAEEERRNAAAAVEVPQPSTEKRTSLASKLLMILGGFVLLGAAGGALAYVFLRETPVVQFTEDPQAPFMLVDATTVVPLQPGELSRQSVMQSLQNARTSSALSLGLIARLYPSAASTDPKSVPTVTSLRTLLSTLSSSIPGEFVRTIDPTYYTLGVHAFDENQALLVMRVDSYEQAYSGMLVWEKTMLQDLSPLFTRTPRPKINQEETSTTTPPVQVLQTTFSDRVVENRDARVVQNEAGDILLLWTFLDRSTIAITTNEHTLREIITRFTDISIVPQF